MAISTMRRLDIETFNRFEPIISENHLDIPEIPVVFGKDGKNYGQLIY